MPAWVVSARESAERDRAATEKGTPSRSLMQRAGNAGAAEITRRYGERLKSGAGVFSGPGHNGGAWWVVFTAFPPAVVKAGVVDTGAPGPLQCPDCGAQRDAAFPRVTIMNA